MRNLPGAVECRPMRLLPRHSLRKAGHRPSGDRGMIWLDVDLSPRVSRWIRDELGHEARALREVGLHDAEDDMIFDRARAEGAIVPTKDKDFGDLVGRLGPPHLP